MKKVTLRIASVFLILGAISLMNFTIIHIDPLTDTATPSSASFEELVTVSCFKDVIKHAGAMEDYACDIDVNGTIYDCIWVINAILSIPSTCETDFPIY